MPPPLPILNLQSFLLCFGKMAVTAEINWPLSQEKGHFCPLLCLGTEKNVEPSLPAFKQGKEDLNCQAQGCCNAFLYYWGDNEPAPLNLTPSIFFCLHLFQTFTFPRHNKEQMDKSRCSVFRNLNFSQDIVHCTWCLAANIGLSPWRSTTLWEKPPSVCNIAGLSKPYWRIDQALFTLL